MEPDYLDSFIRANQTTAANEANPRFAYIIQALLDLDKRKSGSGHRRRIGLKQGLKKALYLARLCHWKLHPARAQKTPILIVSVANDSTINTGPYEDLLFGHLPTALSDASQTDPTIQADQPVQIFVHLLGSAAGYRAQTPNKEIKKRSARIVGFGDATSLWTLLGSLKDALCFKLIWPKPESQADQECRKEIKTLIRQVKLSSLVETLFYERAFTNLLPAGKKAMIIHPWEGNSWEHACRQALIKRDKRQGSLTSKGWCIGIQHNAFLTPPDRQSTRGLVMPKVDLLYCSGDQAKQRIIAEWKVPADKLRSAYSLRLKMLTQRPSSSYTVRPGIAHPRRRPRMLVLLQGGPAYQSVLEAFAIAFATRPDWDISLRLHPAINRAEILRPFDLDRHPQLSVSQTPSLSEDLQRHDIALHAGSSAAFEALSLGCPVVLFKAPNFTAADPLRGLQSFVRQTDEWQGIFEQAEALLSLPPEQFLQEQQTGFDFALNFFRPATLEAQTALVKDLLSHLNLAERYGSTSPQTERINS